MCGSYIIFTDPEHLIVPYENVEQYMFLALFQSHPATIPCRPTYSNANVTLWKENDYQQIQIHPNASLGITYDPRKGFHFDYPRWDSSVLECHYHINTSDGQKYEAKSTISLHWSSKFIVLHCLFVLFKIFIRQNQSINQYIMIVNSVNRSYHIINMKIVKNIDQKKITKHQWY